MNDMTHTNIENTPYFGLVFACSPSGGLNTLSEQGEMLQTFNLRRLFANQRLTLIGQKSYLNRCFQLCLISVWGCDSSLFLIRVSTRSKDFTWWWLISARAASSIFCSFDGYIVLLWSSQSSNIAACFLHCFLLLSEVGITITFLVALAFTKFEEIKDNNSHNGNSLEIKNRPIYCY